MFVCVCSWHLGSRGQRGWQTSYNAQDSSTTEHYQAPNVGSAKVDMVLRAKECYQEKGKGSVRCLPPLSLPRASGYCVHKSVPDCKCGDSPLLMGRGEKNSYLRSKYTSYCLSDPSRLLWKLEF